MKKSAVCLGVFLVGTMSTIPAHAISSILLGIGKDYAQQGDDLRKKGRYDEAAQQYQKALEIDPENTNALFGNANLAFKMHQWTKALRLYGEVIEKEPENTSALFNMGTCFINEGMPKRALHCFKKIVAINPGDIEALKKLGALLQKQNEHKEALWHLRVAQALSPGNLEIMRLVGISLRQLDQLEEAVEQFQKILEHEPGDLQTTLELATTYGLMDKFDLALHYYTKVLKVHPNIKQIRYNYAYILKKKGQIHQSIQLLESLIQDYPDYSAAHFSLALSYLAIGNFERGWLEYEWRWRAHNEHPLKFSKPLWDGSDISGKKILLHTEQGLGDAFQFIRYAKLLKKRGAKIIFQSQKAVADVIRQCEYIDFVTTKNRVPSFDVHAPLMSLPMLFKTTLANIPNEAPYLQADHELIDLWSKELARREQKLGLKNVFRIGICWHGQAAHQSQAVQHIMSRKCISLEKFAPIAKIPGVVLYSLQRIDGLNQLEETQELFTLHTFGDDFDKKHGRFMDTAAVIENLDLVITVDTSVAHLAGAMNAPTWLLLPEPADWRWLIDRNDSPWYPTMRLFRQPTQGDWASVFDAVRLELFKLIGKKMPDLQQSSDYDTYNTTRSKNWMTRENESPIDEEEVLALEDLLDRMGFLLAQAEIALDDQTKIKISNELEKLQEKIEQLEDYYVDTILPQELDDLTHRLLSANKMVLKRKTEFEEARERFEQAKVLKQRIKEKIKNLVNATHCGEKHEQKTL